MQAAVQSAQPIMGAWKALQSRLRLRRDGTVTIITDRPFTFASDGDDRVQGNEIKGNYVAHNDLIMITWDDRSKLNFRWRMHGDKLLLTDHEGKTTQLRRILE